MLLRHGFLFLFRQQGTNNNVGGNPPAGISFHNTKRCVHSYFFLFSVFPDFPISHLGVSVEQPNKQKVVHTNGSVVAAQWW